MSVEHLEVPADRLTTVCNPEDLGFETTGEIVPLQGTIGQERAVSALELALDIDAQGFNLFISGIPGTGRNTALQAHVERVAASKPVPSDLGVRPQLPGPIPAGGHQPGLRDDESVEAGHGRPGGDLPA